MCAFLRTAVDDRYDRIIIIIVPCVVGLSDGVFGWGVGKRREKKWGADRRY